MRYIQAKSILSRLRQTDSFFGIGYSMNLYRGCQHACIYCDTRSLCYQVGDILQISVKENAIELLEKELAAKRSKKATIGTGSMNDPYMPIEADLQLTRRALQTIAKYRFPVHVITKSNIVERDVDVLQEISSTYAVVSLTITTSDDVLAKKLEPNAPATSLRFKAIEMLAKHGICTGVTMMPLLPYINDTKDNITNILTRAKDSGASYVMPMFGVTLRAGSRDYLYKAFDKCFTGMKEKYETYFGECYECNSPDYSTLLDTCMELSEKLDMPSKMKFYTEENAQLSIF